MIGWIKLHRSIQEHWIFKDESKLKAWLIILITVNYEDKKANFGNTLIECKRGESLLSLDSWAKKFGGTWNKSKVRRFFKLLEDDLMIVTKSEQKTTRLTVCNYESYQDERNDNDTQTTRKRHANDTQTTPTKEGKEIKEGKEVKNKGKRFSPPTHEEINSYCSEVKIQVDAERFIDFYSSKGWMVGKNKMKDWKAACRNWAKRNNSTTKTASQPQKPTAQTIMNVGKPDYNLKF